MARIPVMALGNSLFQNAGELFRAMLHAWRRYGQQAAEAEYHAKYDKPDRFPGHKPLFVDVLAGKLAFMSMVRGNDDFLYAKLEHQFAELAGRVPRVATVIKAAKSLNAALSALWVLVSDTSSEYLQGTGFMLSGVGLVTCAHVLGSKTMAFQPTRPDVQYPVVTSKVDHDCDLAILQIAASHPAGLERGDSTQSPQGSHVRVLGYPDFR